MRSLRVGTRGSLLARCQTAWVIQKIRDKFPELEIEERVVSTRGDLHPETPLPKLPQVGEKGLFTRELEVALCSGEIDLAVHSMKDLPTDLDLHEVTAIDPVKRGLEELHEGLTVGAVPVRANPLDALVTREKQSLDDLRPGAIVGTSSLRRAAQIRRLYPALEITDIRGNLDTRLRKLDQGLVDALILAAAGLERLGWQSGYYFPIPPRISLPAPGQGALAVEIREDDNLMRQLCSEALEDHPARLAVTAERAFLSGLGGGCQVPVGALALVTGDVLRLQGIVIQVDGQRWLSSQVEARLQGDGKEGKQQHAAFQAGIDLANRLLDQGAKEILTCGK
jgi:hydroxymethylbilane synthase